MVFLVILSGPPVSSFEEDLASAALWVCEGECLRTLTAGWAGWGSRVTGPPNFHQGEQSVPLAQWKSRLGLGSSPRVPAHIGGSPGAEIRKEINNQIIIRSSAVWKPGHVGTLDVPIFGSSHEEPKRRHVPLFTSLPFSPSLWSLLTFVLYITRSDFFEKANLYAFPVT